MGGLCESLVCGLPGAKGTEEQSRIGKSFSFPFSFYYFLGFGMITQAGFLTQRPDTRAGIITALAIFVCLDRLRNLISCI